MTWPVGRGRDFLGTYDLATGGVRLLEGGGAKTGAAQQIDIAELAGRNPNLDVGAIKDELALVSEACKPFDLEAFREGHLTPVFFGSALQQFRRRRSAGRAGAIRAAAARAGSRPAQGRGGRAAHDAPSCSRSRPTWIRTIATASPSRGCARASSRAA